VDGWQWHSRRFVPLDRLTWTGTTSRERARPLTASNSTQLPLLRHATRSLSIEAHHDRARPKSATSIRPRNAGRTSP
jgi:hypothetical protein